MLQCSVESRLKMKNENIRYNSKYFAMKRLKFKYVCVIGCY